VTFEWDARKAAANLAKHRIAFQDAATVFMDPLAMTFPDPDHSVAELREITVGYTMKGSWFSFHIAREVGGSGSSALAWQHPANADNMKRTATARRSDELRPEYDLSQLKGGIRGKYFREATAGTNLVLIEPDLAELFPDAAAVNRALRVLAEAARCAAPKRRRTR